MTLVVAGILRRDLAFQNSNKIVVVTTLLQCQVIFGRVSLNQKHQLIVYTIYIVISSYHLIIPYAQHVFLLPLLGGWKTIRHNKEKHDFKDSKLESRHFERRRRLCRSWVLQGDPGMVRKIAWNDGMTTTSCLEFKMMHMHSIHLFL